MNDQNNPNVNSHEPVMLNEIVECFATVPPGVLVDATFGLGGHAKAILDAHPSLQILGLDQDADAISNAEKMISSDASLRGRLTVRRVRFDSLKEVLEELSISEISGALFDLGVSSPQLDIAERGFSYRNDGPLDMRMDQRSELSAADIVNSYEVSELANLIARNADERFARRIAQAIVSARPINTTTHLAEVIVSAIPAPARRTGGHPAKRTFQAIRIEVNKELEILEHALKVAIDTTKANGRIAVLAYHSGENRIVKQVFRSAENDTDEPKVGSPYVHESQLGVRRVRRVRMAQYPSQQEQTQNRRAKSARLRIVEKTLAGARS
ncbi:MAG: 16S rRNA (cytosine(1402)-N(4))-methyltransferase RsmH [Actinomycetota bacterium]|nr:16S rRNA (cytosine(1402)-N(4))-methyltransferase RsmH [Actinomycetota bacterium]